MNKRRVKKILVGARDLIKPRGCWTKNAFARKHGQALQSIDVDIGDCWCMYGAIIKVTAFVHKNRLPACTILEGVAGGALGPFNDHPRTTHEDVMAAFDIAICLAS